MKITTLVYPIVGETQAEAEDKKAAYDTLPNDDRLAVAALGGAELRLRHARGWTSRSPTRRSPASPGCRGCAIACSRRAASANPTARDFMHCHRARQARATPWVGGPKEIADKFEEWFIGRACDGFVIGPTHLPGAFEDFVRLVVPELQRRGLFRTEYSGTTLRDHLGLAYPTIGGWRR